MTDGAACLPGPEQGKGRAPYQEPVGGAALEGTGGALRALHQKPRRIRRRTSRRSRQRGRRVALEPRALPVGLAEPLVVEVELLVLGLDFPPAPLGRHRQQRA